jgi:DNA gyrase subunit B
MKRQLLELGLSDAQFDPRDGRIIRGEEIERLCKTLSALEESILALERRGINLRDHAVRQDPKTAKLPVFHVYYNQEEYWIHSRKELDQFLSEREAETGKEADVSKSSVEPSTAALTEEGLETPRMRIVELHEVRSMNRQLADLREVGFEIDSLIPQERTGTEEARYLLHRGEQQIALEDLRGLLSAIRSAGEKGLELTRFKGLGEMNAEELRETTLNPENRTLVQVTMDDASAADDLFRVLMGDKVEPRREFIEKHALEVRNLDI